MECKQAELKHKYAAAIRDRDAYEGKYKSERKSSFFWMTLTGVVSILFALTLVIL